MSLCVFFLIIDSYTEEKITFKNVHIHEDAVGNSETELLQDVMFIITYISIICFNLRKVDNLTSLLVLMLVDHNNDTQRESGCLF